MNKTLKWMGFASAAFAVAWYVGTFDYRSALKKETHERRITYCGFFSNSGAIENSQIQECAHTRETFMTAADRAAQLDAARDADVIAEVSRYLRERAKSFNLNAFEPLKSLKGLPSLVPLDEHAAERPDYDRRYLDVVDLIVMSDENDDSIRESFTIFARPLTSSGEHESRMLPDAAGAWTKELDRLTFACPWSEDSAFRGCSGRIFVEATRDEIWGWEPMTIFLLLNPIDEESLFEHYKAENRSRW